MVLKNGKINKVILHVGLHKTGTTSIQNTLFTKINNKLLEKNDYLFPQSLPRNHSIPIYSAFCDYPENYHINIRQGYSIAEIKDINKRYLERLKLEIAEREQSKLIISGEGISFLSIDNLNALKKYLISISKSDVMIKVVIYVRNPVSWSKSAIQQDIKEGKTYQDSLKAVTNVLKNLFRNRMNAFGQVFGKESIDVYTFEEAVAHKYGPVGHFLSTLGFESSEIHKFNIIRANESISLIAGEILSFINEKMPIIKDGKLNERRFNTNLTPILYIKGHKFDIPFNDKKELFESCQDDIKWLKENYRLDYFKLPQESQQYYQLTEEIIEEIKKAYSNPNLSIISRDLVLEYLQKQLKISTNSTNKSLLKKLLEELAP